MCQCPVSGSLAGACPGSAGLLIQAGSSVREFGANLHTVTEHIETTQNLSALKLVPAVAQLGSLLAEKSRYPYCTIQVISFGVRN
jgi:non-ribosomal peptide synthetase component E (peptide arylation enzyme)